MGRKQQRLRARARFRSQGRRQQQPQPQRWRGGHRVLCASISVWPLALSGSQPTWIPGRKEALARLCSRSGSHSQVTHSTAEADAQVGSSEGCKEEGSQSAWWLLKDKIMSRMEGSMEMGARNTGWSGDWGSATTRLDSSLCSGSRCSEKWPPEPSWSPHCRFSESASALYSWESQTPGAAR